VIRGRLSSQDIDIQTVPVPDDFIDILSGIESDCRPQQNGKHGKHVALSEVSIRISVHSAPVKTWGKSAVNPAEHRSSPATFTNQKIYRTKINLGKAPFSLARFARFKTG
jgi:hypothetical protein